MTVGSTPVTLVNRALQEIAGQASVSGNNPTFDGSAAGNAAGVLYTPAVNLLLRQQDYEFALVQVALEAVFSPPPPAPWLHAYLYPPDCMRVRQILPTSWNAFDPQPVRWTVADMLIESAPTAVILTNTATALMSYSSNSVTEAQFDSVFEETLVRLLASELAMALGGRPDFSTKMLEQSGALVSQGAGLDS